MPGTVQLAAVLFCDLARSTELLVRLGDPEFDTRRRQFEAVVRDAVGGNRGRVVKTLGDGAMATFETASDALAAGIALQQAVRRAAQPGGDDLLLRIGISAGEVTADEGDVFGTTVVEASRLCGAAAPGQVLASSTAAVLTRHGPATLRPLEPLALKGFPEPVDAFEVDWTVAPEPGHVGPPLPAALRTSHPIAFVARVKEWEQLTRVWSAGADGGRHAVLLRGEAGAGKTRLAAEFARSIAADGAVVLFGQSREDGGPPYAPIIDALEHLLAHARELGIDDADANRVRSLLRVSHDDERSPNLTIGDDPRAALFQAVTDVLVAAGRRADVLLVLDDLQWAGRPTLQLVLHLLRTPAPLRLCLLATHRETPADINDAFDDALAELHRLDGVSRIQVVGLDSEGVAAFVEAAAGVELDGVLAQAARVLAHQTDGNPFLLGELWRHFIETGALVQENGRWRARRALDAFDSPDSVRSVVGRRIDRLPEPARELLEIAAVTGAVFTVELLATVTEAENVAVLEMLEPAMANATIEQLGPALFGFTHALVWRAIYDRVPPARRAARHLEVARAIERDDITERALSVLARHYAAAVPVADPATATDVAQRAADVAMRSFAFEDAAELLLRVLPLVSDDAARGELILRIAEAELPAGDAESALVHLGEAVEIARACGRSDLLVRASLAYEEARWRLGLPGNEAERLLREVMPYVTDEATRIRALAARGRALALSGDEAADGVIESAITAARARGDEWLLRFTLGTWFNLAWQPHRYGLMLERAFELRLLCSDLDDPRMAVHAQQWLVAAMLVNAEFSGLRDAVAEHRGISERSKEPFHLHLSAAVESTMAVMDGRFADAEARAEEANELASTLSGPDSSGAYGVQMFSLRREQGRLDEVRPVVEAIARLDRAHATWRPALAAMYAELGMLDEARSEVRVLVTPGLPRLPRDSLYLAALSYLADAVAAVGDRTAAATVYASLEPYRNTVVVVGHLIACHGAVDRYLGALAETAGRARDAEPHYVRAIELDARAASPTWLAHSRFRYARFLARQGRRDGPRRAVALLDEVREAARVIGMPALERRAAELLAELDGQVDAEVDAVDGPVEVGPAESITPREREILDCLVDGLSNAEIGRTLHISPNTAANHVRAILLKTGCANRTEAATWAVRRGLAAR